MIDTALILLAAGGSSRLGESKQLLPYKGKTLLTNSLEAALSSAVNLVACVYAAKEVKEVVEKSSLHTNEKIILVENKDWQSGLASSINCGIRAALTKRPETNALMFMTCDQPHVTEQILDNLLVQFANRQTDKLIAASAYADTLGIPAIFAQSLFADLLALSGDKGAKSIIMQNKDKAVAVSFPQGSIDIDTKQEYEELLHRS